MKVVSMNLNGIRSAVRKDFKAWVKEHDPDFIAVQETKAQINTLDPEIVQFDGYTSAFSCAEKKGYSGVGIYAKKAPLTIHRTTGLDWADREGRYIAFEYENFMIVSLYLPSGSSGDARQALKYQMLDHFYQHQLQEYLTLNKPVIICGDWNIAHKTIDIKNAKANEKNSGFLPEERAWLDQVLELGYLDAFREVCDLPHQYTWWSFRGKARENNVGWRIDYQITTPDLKDKILSSQIFPSPRYSDHAPLLVEYQSL
ncbi:exodeoxyribonuclease III [Candidatus Synchoanobacter obligatus]|uniref:Exodeoxyribonuclease III n=1 Tax=Candidatus Synchoanobacter obligatus TaxID=2919597 RepID=A0ABT1L697_9GAMM|nr:exodeoxyribonuclease III [Candidatus Synchoanobacter obligatus]MCP8352418.1 exodeoxyribonuclease III [Candidatus Synchoanobacter obligatus]